MLHNMNNETPIEPPPHLTYRGGDEKEGDIIRAHGCKYEVRAVIRVFADSPDAWVRAVRLANKD